MSEVKSKISRVLATMIKKEVSKQIRKSVAAIDPWVKGLARDIYYIQNYDKNKGRLQRMWNILDKFGIPGEDLASEEDIYEDIINNLSDEQIDELHKRIQTLL